MKTPTLPIGTNGNEKGLTLLETLIVLAVIALLAIAIPLFPGGWLDSVKISEATIQLSADLKVLRRDAIALGRRSSLALVDTNVYELRPLRVRRTLGNDIELSFVTTDVSLARPRGAEVSFYPGGVANGGYFSITLGGLERRLNILWPTGAIEETSPN